jgi:hypothetical protein
MNRRRAGGGRADLRLAMKRELNPARQTVGKTAMTDFDSDGRSRSSSASNQSPRLLQRQQQQLAQQQLAQSGDAADATAHFQDSAQTPAFDAFCAELESDALRLADDHAALVAALHAQMAEATAVNLSHMTHFHRVSVELAAGVDASVAHAKVLARKMAAINQQASMVQKLEQQVYAVAPIFPHRFFHFVW